MSCYSVTGYTFPSRPVVSYGLMVCARDTHRWLLVQRRHSAEILLILKGAYRLSMLPNLLFGITPEEAELLRSCLSGGPGRLKEVYTNIMLDMDDFGYSLTRMAECRNVLTELLNNMTFTSRLSWGWPKGRLQHFPEKETPFECAVREFSEEVEVPLPPPVKVSDIPFIEKISTSSGKNIESRCWVYCVNCEFPLSDCDGNEETRASAWFSPEEVKDRISSPVLFDYVLSLGPW
jgi:ADP-ribose pyrophosphatase YjhB (NUDIX family)